MVEEDNFPLFLSSERVTTPFLFTCVRHSCLSFVQALKGQLTVIFIKKCI